MTGSKIWWDEECPTELSLQRTLMVANVGPARRNLSMQIGIGSASKSADPRLCFQTLALSTRKFRHSLQRRRDPTLSLPKSSAHCSTRSLIQRLRSSLGFKQPPSVTSCSYPHSRLVALQTCRKQPHKLQTSLSPSSIQRASSRKCPSSSLFCFTRPCSRADLSAL